MRREYWKPWQAEQHPELVDTLVIPLHGWRDRKRSVIAGALITATDLPLVADCYWQISQGYAKGCLPGLPNAKMHRVICGATDPKVLVDHINGNPLDNRRDNLRLVTPHQNALNMRPKGGTSQYKGVHLCRATGKWVAQITFSYKAQHLGSFLSEEAAARAYDARARVLHGIHAYLNFPEEVRR